MMADPGVNMESAETEINQPENGVITIQDETDVIMISPDEETPPTISNLEKISISDDETESKTTNLEEIVISDDDNDDNGNVSDEGEVTEIIDDTPQENAPEIPEKLTENASETKAAEVAEECKTIEIAFSSKELLDTYKLEFRAFLKTFKQFKYLEDNNKLVLTNDVDLNSWVVVNSIDGNTCEDCDNEQNDKKRKRKDQCGQTDNDKDNLFILDTEPSCENTSSPIYSRKYKIIADVEPDVEIDNDNNDNKKEQHKVCCFNCSGEHTLRDCHLPKDNRRIKIARQKLNFKPLVRYHEENDGKYSHLKPGMLSETLKKALGVRKHEIPPHVYKMRVMGYPPGWLEEAKVFQSNLALFDIDGNKDSKSKTLSSYTIAPDKIVDYPGFNCRADRGSRDEYNFFGVPPYSTALSKENMIDFVNNMLRNEAAQQAQMEMHSKSPSPTLTDLELQKRQLLEQLTTDNDDNEDSNTSTEQSQFNEIKTQPDDCPPQNIDLTLNASEAGVDNSALNTTQNQSQLDLDLSADLNKTMDTPIEEPQVPVTPSTPQSAINSSLSGTPIIKSMSPYAHLPNLDNFRKDVSPVINFENLPNSTGKYEQMTTVLEKVRSTLKSRFQT